MIIEPEEKDRYFTEGKTKRSIERRRVKEAEPDRFGMGQQGCNKKRLTAKKNQKTPRKINTKKEIYGGRRTTEENLIRDLFQSQNNYHFPLLKTVFTSVFLRLPCGKK